MKKWTSLDFPVRRGEKTMQVKIKSKNALNGIYSGLVSENLNENKTELELNKQRTRRELEQN